MPDEFAELIDRSNAFFADLRVNNEKAWFEPRKEFYVCEIRKPAELLAEILAEDLSRLTGRPHAAKVFRIYRDVRFSKDKSPYNPHLHVLWRQGGDGAAPAWFLGSSPDYLVLGAGMPSMSKEVLTRYREMVDLEGDRLAEAIAAVHGASLAEWGEAPLKRVPKPYTEEHPHADLLKRKALILSAPPADDWRTDGLVPAIRATARSFLPFWRIISDAVC